MCVLKKIGEIIERNRTKKNKCLIKDMIRWKISYKSKKIFQILTYILNGWEQNKKSYLNETKMNNNK